MDIIVRNNLDKNRGYVTVTEPLFNKPFTVNNLSDHTVRFPIGWKGLGRYVPGTLSVSYQGTNVPIIEEDNGIWYSFLEAPIVNDIHDFEVSYVVREQDRLFATGEEGSPYPGEEYFLFPNWLETPGIGKYGFWVGKYLASASDATNLSIGTDITHPCSKKAVRAWGGNNNEYNDKPGYYKTIEEYLDIGKLKGNKFHTMNNREWESIMWWCHVLDIIVDGNLYGYSSNGANLDGKGNTVSPEYLDADTMTEWDLTHPYYFHCTGTGPETWNHNNLEGGIADLVGNKWEVLNGLYYMNSQIHITYESDINTAINLGNLKLTNGNAYTKITSLDNTNSLYDFIPTNSTGIAPNSINGAGVWWTNKSDNMHYPLIRGGSCDIGSHGGLWAFDVSNAASYSYWSFGFRLVCSL